MVYNKAMDILTSDLSVSDPCFLSEQIPIDFGGIIPENRRAGLD